jgi:DNA-binding NarL/FixJ family response regulator
MPITVLLADDHRLVRQGFRRLLDDDPEITVVGEASDGDEAIRMTAALEPDVVVMDSSMPGTQGLAATKAILAARPHIRVLMLSMHAEETLVRLAFDAGASGYILKSAVDLDLADAVKRVAAGDTVIDPMLEPQASTLPGERRRLTPRELEVLELICKGLSNRDIAMVLELSVNTVAVHRTNIMSALGVHKTAELVVYAIQHGLVHL